MSHPVRDFLCSAAPTALALAVGGLCAAPSFAQADADAAARPRSFQDELAAAKARAQALREAAPAQPPGKLDTQPPVLRSITTTGSVDAQLPNQAILTSLKLTDNLSGVVSYGIEYVSPSGLQYVFRSKQVATPLTSLSPTLTVGSYPFSLPEFNVYDEPGTWQATSFYAYDAAGNFVSYSASELAALGSTTFVVTNNGGYDIIGPTLASGTVDTPTIRLSRPPKGTPAGTPPYVSVDLSATDAGNGVVSGTYRAFFVFCHPNGAGGCDDNIYLSGTTNRSGMLANTMTTGAQLRADQTLGQYVMDYLYLYDVAGNYSPYVSTAFGGTTNFADYFPTGTTIFVNE
jgi:hypothetical protein